PGLSPSTAVPCHHNGTATRALPGRSPRIVITTQDIHELWGNLQALSIAPFDGFVSACTATG
ncbi:hypothetical protein LF942_21525, partial [Pectobacterium brasiliense]|nr:hypothetical protein [Pectobacterium brasiliense]